MKHIVKNNEPRILAKLKAEIPNAVYADLGSYPPDEPNRELKADKIIEKSLLEEQGYICAYCMKKVDYIRIEHWYPQNSEEDLQKGQSLQLDYNNFLGVCTGYVYFSADERSEPHCEKARGNIILTISPLHINSVTQIKYTALGLIYSENSIFNNDLDKTLQLNVDILKISRKKAWEGVKIILNNKAKNKSKISVLTEQLEKWRNKKVDNNDGIAKFREYCQVVIYFLEKELKKEQKKNRLHT
jgi:hypothetical protein